MYDFPLELIDEIFNFISLKHYLFGSTKLIFHMRHICQETIIHSAMSIDIPVEIHLLLMHKIINGSDYSSFISENLS
jgi:hypothetical protein